METRYQTISRPWEVENWHVIKDNLFWVEGREL